MSRNAVGFEKWIVHTAIARRTVGILEEMETICASPDGVRWVRLWPDAGGVVEFVEYSRIDTVPSIELEDRM
jgi:hypothetical protein